MRRSCPLGCLLGALLMLLVLPAVGLAAAHEGSPEVTTQPADRPAAAAIDARPTASATSQPGRPPLPSQADPTRPADRLRQFLNAGAGSPTRPGQPKETVRFPKIQKRGFIQAEDGKSEALIEIEGGSIHSIQEGSTLTVSTSQGPSFTFRVTRLSPDEIEIECVAPEGLSKGQKMVIR